MCIRDSLDTNGAHQETTVEVEIPNKEGNRFEERPDVADVKAKWMETLADLNVCSQKGLDVYKRQELFDMPIVGFENHGGRTCINNNKPLGKVLYGAGNDGKSGYELSLIHISERLLFANCSWVFYRGTPIRN